MKPLILVLLLDLVWSCLAGAELRIKGSDTLGAKMVPQLAEAYRKIHPSIKFEIEAEGSSSGFKALLDGSCDIGMSSRPVLENELKQFEAAGLPLKEHVVAHDMIVVIEHAKNNVRNLSLKNVEQVFTGDVVAWDKLGGRGRIVAITRNTSSGTYKTFQKMAMNRRPYGEATRRLAGGESLPSQVSGNVQAIGYCGLAYAGKKGVRAVSIDGVAPTVANVGRYPIARDLVFYTVGDTTPEAQQFIQWVNESDVARGVIERVGFIPRQPRTPEAEDDGARQHADGPEPKPRKRSPK